MPDRAPTTLHDAHDVRVTLDEPLHPDAARLLDEAVWGTDGVCYRAPGSSAKTASLPGQRMLHLYDAGVLRGVYAFAEHTLVDAHGPLRAYYRNSLVVDPQAGGRGFGALLVQHARRALLDADGPPAVVYGFIEHGNTRSLSLSHRAGYTAQWQFEASLWLRQRPREAIDVREVPADVVREQLGQSVVAPDDLTLGAHATRYALMRDGAPIASISARPHRWILADGGPLVRVAARVLPKLGVYGGLLRDGDLSHLRIACPVGPPDALATLIDHLLATHGLHLALAFLDRRDPLRTALLRRAGPAGWLLSGDTASVMLDARAVPTSRRAEWSKMPYIIPLAYPG